LAAFVTVLAEPVILAIKWNLLLREKEINIPLARMVRIVFSSNFLSVAVPTSVGADAVRLLMLKSRQHSLTHSAGSLIADRVLAVLALVVMSMTATAAIWNQIPEKRALVSVGVVSAIILVVIVVMLSPLPSLAAGFIRTRLVPWAVRRFHGHGDPDRVPVARWIIAVNEKIGDIHASFRSFRSAPGVLSKVLALNFVTQLLRVFQVYFLFHAVHNPVPFSREIAFVPIIVLLTLLPISFFGLGVKEGAFLYSFGQTGVPAAICLTVSFITYILIFSAMIPGAMFVCADAVSGRKTEPDASTKGAGT
jgi:uncharacterized protein (TIRG00374 family)